jgi:hypothetical protein
MNFGSTPGSTPLSFRGGAHERENQGGEKLTGKRLVYDDAPDETVSGK